MMQRDNYEIQKGLAQKYFLKFDQNTLIKKFGLQYDENSLYVEFTGEIYRIDRKTAEVTCGSRKSGYHEVLSIFDLLCHSGEKPAQTGEWAPVNSLRGRPAIGVDTKFFDRYAKEFDTDREAFIGACRKLGGKKVLLGDIGFEIGIFYEMSLIVKFYASDDEFPAQVTVLWDADALKYVYYETTFYIVNHLFDKIRQIMQETPA
ncbi:MAG: DUF3786 domain-containing protein [Eubacteriales bacterium]|nr:DUF3786 domain-containing protein [Eubacteriales bacterium]